MNEVTRTKCQELSRLITEGLEAWVKAGELVVEILDEGQSLKDIETETGLSVTLLGQFEKIGRRVVHPKLVHENSCGYRALSKCSYSDQQRFLEEPVEVLCMKEDGETDILRVNVGDLTSRQCKQVFDSGKVRDLAAQRAYIQSRVEESVEKSMAAQYVDKPYLVRGKKVTFMKGAIMTDRDVLRILEEMR